MDTTNKLGTTVTKDLRTVMQDYDFNLSKVECVMFGAGKVAALGHELERRGLKRTIVVTGRTLGGSATLLGLLPKSRPSLKISKHKSGQ